MKKDSVIQVSVVIPCFDVAESILDVITRIGDDVEKVYVVDDCCPENTGDLVERECADPRVRVIRHEENLGVGGAMITGYRAALADGMDIVVKIDGDGQMDPALIGRFLKPIFRGDADYTKGNRFSTIESLATMPWLRKAGNALLSFVSKISTGYWNLMDPTNGYTAIHRTALSSLPLEKLHKGYFFESDMLFRLGTIRAVVRDVPMDAVYAGETSHLNIARAAIEFVQLYVACYLKRVFYTYFLRDFSFATVEMVLGLALVLFGAIFGANAWIESGATGQVASTGTVMIAVLPLIIGFQLLLNALNYDIANVPTIPLQDFDDP
jgi:glycosyltransferase involved in cell wall biosynthesis